MSHPLIVRVLTLLSALLVTGAPAMAKPLVVQASNYTLFYFAKRVATDSFDVQFRAPIGIDPAFWQPGDKDLIAFQRADMILLNGATYEKWLKTVTLPRSTMVDTSKGFSDQFLEAKGDVHQHGNGVAHSHGGIAMTTWLDFSLAVKQAEAIAQRFIEEAPKDEAAISEKLSALKEDLSGLDTRLKAVGKAWNNKETLIASHPVYQYMGEAYGLSIESLEWEPDMKLSNKEQAEIQALISKHQPTHMLWEDHPTKENRAKIEGLGLKNLVIFLCGNRMEGSDWLQIMHSNVLSLESIVK